MKKSQRVVVIGAGFSGLASAGLLAARGHHVILLEQHDYLGGRSGRLQRNGYRFDTGPSWYLMPEVFEHWFALMGSSVSQHLDLRELEVGYRTFFEALPAPVDVGTGEQLREAFEHLETGSSKVLNHYLEEAESDYNFALQKFLYDDFSTPHFLADRTLLGQVPRLAKLLSRSLQTHVANHFSSPEIRQLLGYPAVFLGTSPDRAPALYQLMSHLDLTQGVKYPMGGFAAVADAMGELAVEHGADIRFGARALAIETTSGKHPRVAGVRWTDSTGAEQFSAADAVIGAADVQHLDTALLPPKLQTHSARKFSRRDPGPSAVLVCLGVRGKLPQLEHHNLLFTKDWKENFSRIAEGRLLAQQTSIYVCKPSATDPHVAPAESENLFILVPSPAVVQWGHGGADGEGDALVEQVADAAIDQLAQWAGIPDLRSRIEVRQSIGPADFAELYGAYQGGALGLAHTLCQSAMLRPGNQSKHVSGLYYAGATVRPGIGVPMCLISGELAVKAVEGITQPGPLEEQGRFARLKAAQ